MEFPITNISTNKWTKEEDPMLFMLVDQFIYTGNIRLYRDFYFKQKYVDSKGDIYTVVDRVLPTSFWKSLLRFIPNTYKVELVFKPTAEKMDIETFRNYMIDRIKITFGVPESDNWVNQIKEAKTFKAIMGASV
jgi:hypothetical protein